MNDSVTVIVAGAAQTGSGRPSQLVHEHFPSLDAFMSQWGDGAVAQEELNVADLKKMAQTDPSKVKEYLAKLAADLTATEKKPFQASLNSAVTKWLNVEKGFVISETDPGDNVHYINPGDIVITELSIPNDGTQYIVTLAAPFG